MPQLPDSVAARPITDARLIEKRGPGTEPSLMYAQGDFIVERTFDGSVVIAQPAAQTRPDGTAHLEWFLKTFHPTCTQRVATYLPGEYHPRVHRKSWPNLKAGESILDADRKGLRSFLVAYSALVAPIERIFRVIEPSPANADAYGHEMRQALIIASTEVEAAWRGVLVANAYVSNGARFTTNDYVKLLAPMKLDSWTVKLRFHPEMEVTPFGGWNSGQPTQSLGWYDAYNAVKHDRETALPLATLKRLIEAVAAVHVMGRAQFGYDALDAVMIPDLVMFDVVRKSQWSLEERYIKAPTHIAKNLSL